MSIDFFMGTPQRNGEYVCYIQDRTQPEWSRPIILHWFEGRWQFPRSDRDYPGDVYGWCGPLPVGRLDDPFPPTVQEFDL